MSAGFTPPAPRRPGDPAPTAMTGIAVEGDARHTDPVDPRVFVNEFTRPLPDPATTFAGPGYRVEPMPTSPWAVVSLVFGLAGPVVLGLAAMIIFGEPWPILIGAVTAVVAGHLGLSQLRGNAHQGRGLAMAGLVLGYGLLAFYGLIWATTAVLTA